ncbi:MAG: hypothetical protein RBT75_20480 [Anaerolineae bacterium]|jgi:hypothetical protein|nr:hypothetical protein [Anaerolineae bacterium]
MIDRELIEQAALAAGITGEWGHEGYIERNEGFIPQGWRRAWNPLRIDGDAFQLSVKLALTIYHWPHEICVCNENNTVNVSVPRVGDTNAATRRAIALAAAEIGRNIP